MLSQYFAQIDDNNVVTDIAVVHKAFLEANPDRYTGIWVETFFNRNDKTYAGIGWTYSYETQDFTPPPKPDEP